MSKNLTNVQWMNVINMYHDYGSDLAMELYISYKNNLIRKDYVLARRIKNKVFLVDNFGMDTLNRKQGSGRNKKRDDSDIPQIIDELNEEQKREIIEAWIKSQRDKRNKKEINSIKTLPVVMKAKISGFHRTSFYKQKKANALKWDFLKSIVLDILNKCKWIYGSGKISQKLKEIGYVVSDRTLRNYMVRWGFVIKTRVKRKRAEIKNTTVTFKDLVKRNFNPLEDNIIATDVSYIPANIEQNNIYLSAAINHKTKLIESWCLSKENDTQLVIDTINKINRNSFILHSDHGAQYSSNRVQDLLRKNGSKTSMGRVGNSLDNREIEYFFGCLKGEYLSKLKTYKMSYQEIYNEIEWYINWYNSKRIQKKLNWKAPAFASAFSS